MKMKFLHITSIAMAAIAMILTLNSCGDDKDFDDEDGAPTITWESNPSFSTQEISSEMNVDLKVTSPNGIQSFVIKITSPDATFTALLDVMVSEANSSAKNNGKVVLDLTSDVKVAASLKPFGVPTGTDLLYKTSVDFSLSSLVPMIGSVARTEGDYVFETTVTDRNGKSVTKSPTFHLTVK